MTLPKVLLLGDSIRISYQPIVADLLRGRAEVVGPAENCQYSLYTLSALPRWIEALGEPDVVHWNNGLHDCGHNPDRYPVQMPIDTYAANLELILGRLRQTSRVVWATSTPVHPDRPFRDDQWSWRLDEIDAYNARAAQIMRRHGVPINDLHAPVRADMKKQLDTDLLHLSSVGRRACGEAVVRAVEALLS